VQGVDLSANQKQVKYLNLVLLNRSYALFGDAHKKPLTGFLRLPSIA